MIRIAAIFLITFGTFVSYAANVEWNSVVSWYSADLFKIGNHIGGGMADLSIGLSVTSESSGSYTLRCMVVDALFVGNWVSATTGDLVDASTVRKIDSYFVHAYIDDRQYSSADLNVEAESDFYLSFVTAEDMDLVPDDQMTCYYGWVGFNIDKNGVISVIGSAWDLDGGPMIVGGGAAGPTPEPSGGVLVVFGAALLALRRRRR